MANRLTTKRLLAIGLFLSGYTCLAQSNPSVPAQVTNSGKGGVAVGENKGTINIGIDAKQFQEMLNELKRNLVVKLRSADPKDKQRIQELEAEKKALAQQLANFTETFKEYQVKLAELAKELESWRGSVPDESLDKAQQALARGDTQAADQLFADLVDNIKRKRDAEDSKLAQAYYQRGGLAKLRIDYGQAMRHYTDAVQAQPNNPTYLRTAGTMARTVGRYEQARIWLEHVVELLGQQAPDTLDWAGAAYDLAWLYFYIADYAQAEPLYLRAFAITEKALGKDHPDVANTLNALATLYQAQGHYPQAEPLYLRDLAITEKALGKDHPDVAVTLNNLARLYQAQGHYAQAEPLHLRALVIREKVLGKDHPYVATTLNNLAGLYRVQGHYSQAEPLYLRAIKIAELRLGADHPNTVTFKDNYQAILRAQR